MFDGNVLKLMFQWEFASIYAEVASGRGGMRCLRLYSRLTGHKTYYGGGLCTVMCCCLLGLKGYELMILRLLDVARGAIMKEVEEWEGCGRSSG